MAGTSVPQRYGLRFINGDGGVIDFSRLELDPLARQGEWTAPPFSYTVEPNPDGSQAAVSGVQYTRPSIIVPSRIQAIANTPLRTLLEQFGDVLGPQLADGSPNRGYLEFTRLLDIAVSDMWLMPVIPNPWQMQPITPAHATTFDTEFSFLCLDAAWQGDPPVANARVVSPVGAWDTITWNENPGRPSNMPVIPYWEIDGPTSGTIDSVSIQNNTSGQGMTFSNLALATGQTLKIACGFMQQSVLIGTTDTYYKRGQNSIFWLLRPLANNITITKNASSTSAVRLTYRHRRVGIY